MAMEWESRTREVTREEVEERGRQALNPDQVAVAHWGARMQFMETIAARTRVKQRDTCRKLEMMSHGAAETLYTGVAVLRSHRS